MYAVVCLLCRVLMQKVAKEYMTTMRSPAVQARLKAGQTPLKASASSLAQADTIRQCFAARDGRLLGLLVSNRAAADSCIPSMLCAFTSKSVLALIS